MNKTIKSQHSRKDAAAAKRPKAPKRNCKKASVWKVYYERMQEFFQESAAILAKYYPGTAEKCLCDAKRFEEGAKEIANRTHPNIVSGEWK